MYVAVYPINNYSIPLLLSQVLFTQIISKVHSQPWNTWGKVGPFEIWWDCIDTTMTGLSTVQHPTNTQNDTLMYCKTWEQAEADER